MEPEIRLEMRSNPLYLSGARELISALSKRLGFDDIACCQIALAVDEALSNVIRHGYDRRLDGRIWISLFPRIGDVDSGDPASLRIVIEDEAKQVDLDAIKGRELEDIKPGGLGVHIMREIMDEVTFEHREPGGMRLTMEKLAEERGR